MPSSPRHPSFPHSSHQAPCTLYSSQLGDYHSSLSYSHLHVLASVFPSLSHLTLNPPSPSSTPQAPRPLLTSLNPNPSQPSVSISTWNVPHTWSFPFLSGYIHLLLLTTCYSPCPLPRTRSCAFEVRNPVLPTSLTQHCA